MYHYGVGGKQWSAIVFTVFEKSKSVQIWVEKGAEYFKLCSKSGQLGVTRGHQGVSQVGFSQGSARGHLYIFIYN